MNEILEMCVQNGFSVAVAAYLLVKVEARIEELTNAVTKLVTVIERMECQKGTDE